MINSDVQLFWANDAIGDIAIIFDMVEEDRNNKYTCPVCGSEVKPVAIGGKTKDGKVAQVSSHFSHFDASKCSNESAIHYWFKNQILINGDSFIIKTDEEHEYKCKEVLIEQFYRTEFGIYKPDITIITECDNRIYFEMNYTNKKKVEDYMDKWLELGNPVVEVDIKMLMDASFNKTKYWFKALFYEGKCFNTKKNDLYYDTIGQLKERICKNNVIDNEIRERIKKLDWFWLETINYKRGETNIEQLVNYIDYTEQDEKDLIFMILSKKRCVPIYEDYINFKVDLFEKLAIYYINNIDTNYRDSFEINKRKIIKKYKKNIPYDTILITNSNFNEPKSFCVEKYDEKNYINCIKGYIDTAITLFPYIEKSNNICLLIEKKYKDEKFKGLYLSYTKGLGFTLNTIKLKEHWPYNTEYMDIKISKSLFKNNECKIADIINLDENIIIDCISNAIEEGVEKYTEKLLEKEKKEHEELLLKHQKDREEFRKILIKITNIFDNNKEKIIDYKLDYILDNLLYFKDYRGIEFIIKKDYSPPLEEYEDKYNFIDINLSLNDDIYIIETENSYKIRYNLVKPNYIFPNYFTNPEINLSFKDIGYGVKHLPRYNFLNVANKLNDIFNKLSLNKSDFIKNYKKSFGDKIYLPTDITDEEINKEIYKLLYPIIYLADKNPNNILNIKLNIDFTIKDGKKQPWLIKGFIESLEKLGIQNIYNII